MLKLIVFFYLVFEVSSKRNEHSKASTKEMSALSPQAVKGTAELIYLINKQLSDEKENSDYNDKNVKVDLDYYHTGYDDRKRSVMELMQLIQKNYDASIKYDPKGTNNGVRIHVLSNPEVLENYKKKLAGQSKPSKVDDFSEYSEYSIKNKLKSKRRKAVFRFDSLSKETAVNLNADEEQSMKERDKKFEDSLKEHFNGKLAKLISEDSLNPNVYQDELKTESEGRKGTLFHRLGDSLEVFKKEQARDWQKQDDNKSSAGSKETLSTKGLWQMDNSREESKKGWVDYDKPKKTTKNDDYHYDSVKGEKEKDKDDWGQTRKSKNSQWNDNDTTKKDSNNGWEKNDKSVKVKNKDDDWSQVGLPKKWEEDSKTSKKHVDFDRVDKNNKNKWSIEVAEVSKTTKNSNSRSAKSNFNKYDDNSYEKKKKEKKEKKRDDWGKKDDSWDIWSEKKPIKSWAVKKSQDRVEKMNDRVYKPKIDNYNDKSKKAKNKDTGRGSFGRTPIPFVGKKGIYED